MGDAISQCAAKDDVKLLDPNRGLCVCGDESCGPTDELGCIITPMGKAGGKLNRFKKEGFEDVLVDSQQTLQDQPQATQENTGRHPSAAEYSIAARNDAEYESGYVAFPTYVLEVPDVPHGDLDSEYQPTARSHYQRSVSGGSQQQAPEAAQAEPYQAEEAAQWMDFTGPGSSSSRNGFGAQSSKWIGRIQNGYGVMTTEDGQRFEGHFVNGQAHGHGRYDGKHSCCYEGQWSEDRAHGLGTYSHLDGSVYNGRWVMDQKAGRGIETWPSGASYEGEFLDGKKHGHGIYKDGRGVVYEGQFRLEQIEGEGRYKYPDGRLYVGQFEGGHMNGQGTFDYPNGCRYMGSYKDDFKNGEGVFTWADGRQYKGQWFNGKQHGCGVTLDLHGVMTPGEWNAGQLVGSAAQTPAKQAPSPSSGMLRSPSGRSVGTGVSPRAKIAPKAKPEARPPPGFVNEM
eukprot:TRINITY_DN23718_c0_g1_i1.p1 TRINITY_DN23718_c0_g1~~TRINITY_DN23718_c0_g1_i1.p1  ORF type:complete len:475 (+),score=74.06 TRINITY_DN23718_c0_g1_i1:64-1425(+)